MEQPSPSLAFVSYDPTGGKRGTQRARAIRIHAGKVGWSRSSKAAEVEARKKKRERNKIDNEHSDTKDAELLPRPFAPAFGGVSLKTFDSTEDDISKRIGYLMLSAVWPNVAGESVAAAWFVDFCNDPLMFHTHCTAGSMYRDVIAQNPEWSNGKTALTHKAQSLSMIKSAFDNLASLSRAEIERLLLSMGILGTHEFERKHVEHKPIPFVPFHPAANWVALWGRSDPIEAHINASITLANRLGGPKALQLPGLGYMAAFTDIVFASCHLRKPLVKECFWDDVHIFDVMPDELCRPAAGLNDELHPPPGAGFGNLTGGLPPTALSVFTQVAYTDRILVLSHAQAHPTHPVQRVRLATSHKLLSLPTWDELDNESKTDYTDNYKFAYDPEPTGKCHRAVYEICRITCIIYSAACFFPLPPHNGWNTRLTSRAMELLEVANFDMWCPDVEELYLWALFICGMAAYDTPNRPWFEGRLGKLAHRRRICVENALQRARRFVWTDWVCEAGARELWDAAMNRQPTPQEDVKYVMEWGQL